MVGVGVGVALVSQLAACTGSTTGGAPSGSGGGPGGAGSPGTGGAVTPGTGTGGNGGGSGAGTGGSTVIGGAGGATTDGGVAAPDAGTRDSGGVVVLPPSDAGPGTLGGGPVPTSTTHLDIGVHDPSMIWDGSKYYLFATGGTISYRSSTNLSQWANAGRVYTAIPSWATAIVGSGLTSIWAPDPSYFNGLFHVYWAGSTFGSNTSVIGLATNTTLDPTGAGYAWVDRGLVIQSRSADNFNAIDPNVAFDGTGAPWLAFGSFWSGIKLRKLDPVTGLPATDDTTLYGIASRNGGAIEASSIISHNGFYYLFVSFDRCCQGVNSTYRTMAGRATAITGPYADSKGTAMMNSGGDELIVTTGRYIGPGGGTAWKDGNNYLYVYHYYDGEDAGRSKLLIRPISFSATDWPVLGDPIFP